MMNYNVRLSLWWTVVENISASIRAGDALSAFVFLQTDSNKAVGIIQGINGVVQLVVSLPAGWLADRRRRDLVLRIGAMMGLCGGLSLLAAMLSTWMTNSILRVGVAMSLLGSYRGIYTPALEAIFADSVEVGRTGPYTWRYVLMISSSGVGPLLSAGLFLYMHSTSWSETDCRNVVLAGTILMLPALLMMCFFDDDKALSDSSEAEPLLQGPILSMERLASPNERNSYPCGEQMESDECSHVLEADPETLDLQEGSVLHEERLSNGNIGAVDAISQRLQPSMLTQCKTVLISLFKTPSIAVPFFLTLSDFIGALASGMTLRFFSLFFMQVVKFAPVRVSLLSAASPFGISMASILAQRAGKRVGRVQIGLITRILDIVLLILLAKIPVTSNLNKELLVVVHLSRMAFANCTRPLLRSVLNEFVAKRHRARVNAVDSIRTFSWSGSAAFGGFLIEKYGFEHTFTITALIKVISFIPLIFLLQFVSDGIGAGGRNLSAIRATNPENMEFYGEMESEGEDENSGHSVEKGAEH